MQLARQALYFLAVDCTGSLSVEGTPASGVSSFTTPLIGAFGFASITTQITAPWTLGSGGLPATFTSGGAITIPNAGVPNVYAGP